MASESERGSLIVASERRPVPSTCRVSRTVSGLFCFQQPRGAADGHTRCCRCGPALRMAAFYTPYFAQFTTRQGRQATKSHLWIFLYNSMAVRNDFLSALVQTHPPKDKFLFKDIKTLFMRAFRNSIVVPLRRRTSPFKCNYKVSRSTTGHQSS